MKKYLDITSWVLLFFFAPFTILILLSQNSIPGDTFYPVKRGLENAILAAASVSPSTKVAFRTDLTQRRFTEAQELLTTRADTTAFTEFVGEVSTTQQDLSNLSSSQEKIQNADKLIAKIDEYQLQLSQTQNQVQLAQSQPQILPGQPAQSEAPVPSSSVSQKICIQVVTYARNPSTEVCQSFSTPCDVPDGWQKCSPGEQQAGPSTIQNPPSQTTGQAQQATPTPNIQQPQITASPAPAASLAPSVTTEISQNPAKGQEVKNKISDTKEELQKIKEKVKKERDDAQLKEKIKEEQNKLKEGIKNATPTPVK